VEELEQTTEELTRTLQDTIKAIVPEVKISPYMKRWWTKELEVLKKELNRMNRKALKAKYNMGNPIHSELRDLKNSYADAIIAAKRSHWEEFLEEAAEREMWIANRYLTEPVGDGGSPRIPTLKTKDHLGNTTTHTTNEEKANALNSTFFPKRPQHAQTSGEVYPEPHPIRNRITVTIRNHMLPSLLSVSLFVYAFHLFPFSLNLLRLSTCSHDHSDTLVIVTQPDSINSYPG
jgi:hypothetical protein